MKEVWVGGLVAWETDSGVLTCGLEFYRFQKYFKENVQKLGGRLHQLFFKNLDWYEKGRCALRIKLCILKYMGKIVLKEERDGDRKDKKATRERMELKSKMDSGGLK